ncbi:MAG: hypothetical protein ABSH24_16290 [Bryobacteraceae bacterium]|jgi:NRPS condensation-like uncharacterized protein
MDYTAEVFDQVQLLFDVTRFHDHQLHCVLKFDSGLDPQVLQKAVISSIQAVPILGTRYIDGGRPRWTSVGPEEFREAFIVARTEAEFEEFVVSRIDESQGPQVKVCLLGSSPCAVALTMNHMICDAADFKRYLYFLCEIYSGLIADPAYRPAGIAGDRSMRGVLQFFGMREKFKSLFSQSKENNRCGEQRFPLSGGGEVRSFILTCKLGRQRTAALKDYGRAKGATLNDAVLAAYYRCLSRSLALSPGTEVQIPVMVDMRRYVGEIGSSMSLTNLTSTVITRLEYRSDEGFEDTLGRVKAAMDEKKNSDIGLNGFIKLDLLYRICGNRIANRTLRSTLKNPLICMTNVGILDAARICFGNLRPRDAYLCGAIKYKPHFQLAISSYAGELTLSANLYGSVSDRDRILSFFDAIAAELPD